MRRRHQRFGLAPFALITAGLFLASACHVVDGRRETSCRSAGTAAVELVAAVEGRGGGAGGGGSRGSSSRSGSNSGTVQRPAERPGGGVDVRKRDQAPAVRPPARDQVRKDPDPVRPDRAHPTTPSPSPSSTRVCK